MVGSYPLEFNDGYQGQGEQITARPAKSWVPHLCIQANKNNRWPKSFTLCFVKSMQMLYIYTVYICIYTYNHYIYIYYPWFGGISRVSSCQFTRNETLGFLRVPRFAGASFVEGGTLLGGHCSWVSNLRHPGS